MTEAVASLNKSPEEIRNEVRSVGDRLVSGMLTPPQARDALIALDQSDPGRVAAPHILELLVTESVQRVFLSWAPEEGESGHDMYYSLRSFIEFHCAQIAGMQDDYDRAVTYASQSADSMRKVSVDPTQRDAFDASEAYVEGTKLYFEGKLIPDELIQKVSGINKAILLRLNKGIEERGYPDYKVDYSSTS